MSLGKGAIYSTSTRQKLVTKSSTEGELVGVADVMPQILWTRYFLAAQGYKVTESIVYQDNQSAMLLEKNGCGSSSKRTCHINIGYFFVQNCVANNEVKIEYCPTGNMLANYFTKPLQGTLVKKFCDLIMNCDDDPCLPNGHQDHRSVLRNDKSTPVVQDGHDVGGNPKPSEGSDDPGTWMPVTHKKRHRKIEDATKVEDRRSGGSNKVVRTRNAHFKSLSGLLYSRHPSIRIVQGCRLVDAEARLENSWFQQACLAFQSDTVA